MKDLYQRLGFGTAPSYLVDPATIRRAIRSKRVKPADRQAAEFVLLDPSRKARYDCTRDLLHQIGTVRARLGLTNTDSWPIAKLQDFTPKDVSYKSELTEFVQQSVPAQRGREPASGKEKAILALVALAVGVFFLFLISWVVDNINKYSGNDQDSMAQGPDPSSPGQVQDPAPADEKEIRLAESNRAPFVPGLLQSRDDTTKHWTYENQDNSKEEREPSIDPKPTPQTGVLSRDPSERSYVAPLEVITPDTGKHYFLNFEDQTTGSTVLTAFVRSGERLDTLMPTGTYVFEYAVGFQWYGQELLFGSEPMTICYRAQRKFKFEKKVDRYAGYVIELIATESGNLPTTEIDRDEFLTTPP